MKKTFLLCCSLIAYLFLSGQINNEFKSASERIFIHTDKSTCIAGDTLWFKTYLFDGYQPGSASTNLFVELIDEKARLISKQKLPVFDAAASGFFAIGDSLEHGFYFLRAYTPQMIAAQQNIPSKLIAVLNIGYMPQKYLQQASPSEYKMQFYPESGSLISGLSNSVAFKITDEYGNGLNTSVSIYDATGDTIKTITIMQDGMGVFSFVPAANEKYSAEIKLNNGEKKKFDLPAAQQAGVVLSVAENSKGKIYLVQKSPELFKKEKAELLGSMYGNIVFRHPLKFENNESSGLIPLSDLPPGILHLSVVNEKEEQLAFRPVVITKPDLQAGILFYKDTVNLSPKGKNVFSVQLPDTAEGNFSVSVIALNSSNTAINNNSILNSVLVSSESEMPAIEQSLFQNKDKADLLALTDRLKQPFPDKQIVPELDNYISVSGKVLKYGSKKVVTKGTLLMYLQTKDSLNTFLKVPVNNDGTIKLEGMVFDDSARFNYQPDDKKMGKLELIVDPQKEISSPSFTLPKDQLLPFDKIAVTKPEIKRELTIAKTYLEKTKEEYKLLQGVTVKAVRRRPIDQVNRRYTSGLFSGMGSVHVLDLINDPPQGGAQNVLQYLQGRVAGLRIDWRGGNNYSLTTSRAMSVTGGLIPVQIFLNEMEVDLQQVLPISLKDIALIKYFPAGSNTMIGFGISGKLAIYTKKVEDYTPAELGQYNFFFVEGYTPTKEFTSPDYSNGIYTNEDKRQTLYWNPDMYITTDQRQAKIRFFNSDNATKFKVVIQGYTYDGRFIDFEKIIE